MEAPECPVCLQSYDEDNTIPRVLGCGHSACQTCLAHLHRLSISSSPLPHTLRCPACTQLVKFPHPQGPTALPKNIDLLRFSLLLQYPNSNANTSPLKVNSAPTPRLFLPELWSDELYTAWKDFILPDGAVLVVDDGLSSLVCARLCTDFTDVTLSASMRCRLVEHQEVGLVQLGRFELDDPVLEYSYVSKVMAVLGRMNDSLRAEISSILGLSLKTSGVCNVFGLWLDGKNDGSLYLVTDRMKNRLLNLEYEIGQDDGHGGYYLGSFGVELCEALISFHLQGFVCGCLGLSSVCFDLFGHVCLDLGETLVIGRKFREYVVERVRGGQKIDDSEVEALIGKMSNMDAFVSPEVMLELLCMEGFDMEKNDGSCTICYSSDVWVLACVLVRLVIGNQFALEMYNYLRGVFQGKNEGLSGCENLYLQWVDSVKVMLEPYASVHEILLKCLDFDPRSRPLLMDVWKSIKGLNMYLSSNHVPSLNIGSLEENVGHCLMLGELCNMSNNQKTELSTSKLPDEHDDCKPELTLAEGVEVDNIVVKGLSAGKLQCKTLQAHLDCITGFCVGGGYLFSSSFDKTINVWSLQDFTHVHTFRGHEHRIMALVFVNQEKPLCISADSGGGIFAWEINEPLAKEPLINWYEEKDWRYSGIHALAVSESGCLYTGSGDRLIKAWLLREHSLVCSMEGHKSVVSTLAICNGVLYSGSWDGTVRLWCLHDHSPLAVFGEDTPGTMSSVLSLFADQNTIIAAHENGCIKVLSFDPTMSCLIGLGQYHNHNRYSFMLFFMDVKAIIRFFLSSWTYGSAEDSSILY